MPLAPEGVRSFLGLVPVDAGPFLELVPADARPVLDGAGILGGLFRPDAAVVFGTVDELVAADVLCVPDAAGAFDAMSGVLPESVF